MKFEVLSREKARKLSFKQDIEDCVIVSITDVDSHYNSFAQNPHIKGVCHIKFDDVDFGETNCITAEDGVKIVNFINHYVGKVDKIIVHCEAGVSRSAGVCAALMQIINGSDMEIFENPKFCPNMSCYRTILETYYGSYDKEAADIKIRENIRLWRIANDLEEEER
jgi:hypothetical protein